jgi:hypothetical protein
VIHDLIAVIKKENWESVVRTGKKEALEPSVQPKQGKEGNVKKAEEQ